MQKRLIQLLVCATSLGFVSASALAASDSFVGKWKLDPNKSQFTGLQYKIEDAGGGKYRFVFGDDVETLAIDGKGHVTKFGDSWAIKPTGPNNWESTTMRDGKLTNRSKWTISKDGKTFTSADENMRPDGSTGHTTATLRRTSGTSGLVGTWESTSIKVSSPNPIEIATWQGDGYSLIKPVFKERTDFKLDGKSYTPVGPRVAKGITVAGKKTGNNMQLTYKLKGKAIETDTWAISNAGKTLTQTVSYSGVSRPEVDVYNRE